MSQNSPTPSQLPAATLLLDADLEVPTIVTLPHGLAAAVSVPHPIRGTPNQDAAAILPTGPDEVLLVVADGMGGTRGGGEAAGTIIRHLSKQLPAKPEDLPMRAAILDGIESANQHLLENVRDAGTTLAAVEVNLHTIRPYHIGDSVILVVGQRGKLKLQTVSHSPVGLAVEAGLLDEEEALHHHERHLILNAIGSPEMRIELGAPLTLSRYDTVLLASDGLTDNLTLDEIISLVRKGPLDRAVAKLASLARGRMLARESGSPCKPDDLTILAYRRSS